MVAAGRGGASDASHFAASIPMTVDGLGPRGGGAHAPHEYMLAASLRPRAEVALAIADAVLARLTTQVRWPSSNSVKEGTPQPPTLGMLPRSL